MGQKKQGSVPAVHRSGTEPQHKSHETKNHKCAVRQESPGIQEKLLSGEDAGCRSRTKETGISQIIVAPVGLDRTLLKPDYEQYGSEEIKEKYGFQKRDRIILFIGRLTEEKQPLRMVKLFAYIFERDKDFRLLMVGTGEQGDNVAEVIEAYNLGERVRRIERISNSEIWEIYRFSEVFVNLNQQEIFGMAILEAMYYGCKVVAWKAPGPDFIIENGISGWIVENEEQLLCRVLEENEESRSDFMIVNARKRIIRDFTWDSTVQKILLYIREAS